MSLYSFQDGIYVQKLISPTTEEGGKMTLKDLLEQFSTERSKGENSIIHGALCDYD